MSLSVRVRHSQGDFTLEAAFEAPPGVTALFGRSGSGKTTLVELIAGLRRPDEARIVAGSAVLVDTESRVRVPPHRRRIGLVFQDARLFPHLSVRHNLLFGRLFAPRAEPGPDLEEVVELLGIHTLLERRPAGLSGGERQRVAIGRALLAKPRLLLLDEPLAALDDARRAEILPFLERLRDAARVPIVYVSHSAAEVARLADTLVVLEGGRVVAFGPIGAVLERLDVPALSSLRDLGAVLDVEVARHDEAFVLTSLSTPAGTLLVPALPRPPGTRLRVRIAARDVMLFLNRPTGLSALNVLPARVETVAAPRDGEAATEVLLRCGDAALLARVTRLSADRLGLAPGLALYAVVKSVALDGGPGERVG